MKFYKDIKLGILGGGQLGRMLIQSSIDLNIFIGILDPSNNAPAKPYAHEFTQGSLTDFETVYNFGQNYDVITIEIENVNTSALKALKKEGKQVYPDPETISLIQNKALQKEFYKANSIPSSDFKRIKGINEINESDLPIVQKSEEAGYDGKGVQILRTPEDLTNAFDCPSILESLVDVEKEVSVIAARNFKGEIKIFPLVEMVFDPEQNQIDYLFAPANITESQEKESIDIAREILGKLDYVGLMAIELFINTSGQVLVNEIAPRPHNSGHHTIRACMTSQYEQHLRAVLNLSLGSTSQMNPAAMVNIIGRYKNIESLLSIGGAYPHIYGKEEASPKRKMGHITILGKDQEELNKKVNQVKEIIK